MVSPRTPDQVLTYIHAVFYKLQLDLGQLRKCFEFWFSKRLVHLHESNEKVHGMKSFFCLFGQDDVSEQKSLKSIPTGCSATESDNRPGSW